MVVRGIVALMWFAVFVWFVMVCVSLSLEHANRPGKNSIIIPT